MALLREYLEQSLDDDKVLIICRLLFVNPKGWNPPRLGEVVPAIDEGSMKKFPLFPFGIEDNVPFLLVRGYQRGGRPESALACVDACAAFDLIKSDYAVTGYESAAKSLTQSESFRQLYQTKDLPDMVEMITSQAKPGEPIN